MHTIWKLIIILVFCILLVNYLPFVLPERVREPNLNLPLMFLKEELLISGAKTAYGPEEIDNRNQIWGVENLRMAISLPKSSGFINQYIYRFRNELGAIYQQKALKKDFTLFEGNNKIINYLSPTADIWEVSCEEISVDAGRCRVFSRYDEVIGILLITYKNNVYSIGQLNQLIEYFDLQISNQMFFSNKSECHIK